MPLEEIIQKFNLPPIPACKIYHANLQTNPEQDAILKCISHKALTAEDEMHLKEAIEFYKAVFPALQAIPLSEISLQDSEDLKKYLEAVFNFNLMVTNDIHFEVIFRVSVIKDSFLEKGKVRSPKYLRYPDLDIIKKAGIYNRANSFNATVFYASFHEHVALRETKPEKGQRIIISVWKNITGKPFNSYPITNASIQNEGVQKATKAFKETKAANHPLFAEIMDLILAFLASEFVKDVPINHPNRLEYFYSAFFADRLLSPLRADDPSPNYDFIIYPSVAWKHQHENVAMTKDSLDAKMKIIHAIEYEVGDTFYDKELGLDEAPAKLKFLREAKWFEKDLIIWEDE
jgi:hypothetical protein